VVVLLNADAVRPRPLRSVVGALAPMLLSRASWDRQFARGDWDRLRDGDERAHHAAIVACLARPGRPPRVLDVGCGDGALAELLAGLPCARYHGIDHSREALRRARPGGPPGATHEVVDVGAFTTAERYDAIVFSELLYYLRRPADVLRRYAGFLADDGVLIVSMFDYFRARRAWRAIDRRFVTLEAHHLTGGHGQRWDVRALAPW